MPSEVVRLAHSVCALPATHSIAIDFPFFTATFFTFFDPAV